MDWALLPLKRYADFAGRSRRIEFWAFALAIGAINIVLSLLTGVLAMLTPSAALSGMSALPGLLLFLVVMLALIVPGFAVMARRFHDQDRSGWFVLLNFIPYVGTLIVLVFMCVEGTRGPNRYGPDPKAGALSGIA